MEQGYMIHYNDDFNKKHITYVKNYSSVNFYKERYGSQNVVIDPQKVNIIQIEKVAF